MDHRENAMLLTATNVEPASEEDFNDWYDVEHLVDKLRVEGVVSGARYVAKDGDPRYLCIYRAASLDVFASPAYARLLWSKSRWTVASLDVMRQPVRRVCSIREIAGRGSGSWLTLFTLGADDVDFSCADATRALGPRVAGVPGMVHAYWLTPAAELSGPLPRASSGEMEIQPFLVVESNSESASLAAVDICTRSLASAPRRVARYCLLWKLFASELA